MEVRTKTIQPRLIQLQAQNKRLLNDLTSLHNLHSQLLLVLESDRVQIHRLQQIKQENEQIIDGLSEQLSKSVKTMQIVTRQNQSLLQQISQNKLALEDSHRISVPSRSKNYFLKQKNQSATPFRNSETRLSQSRADQLQIRLNSTLRDKQLLQTQLSRRDYEILRLRGDIHRYQKETIAFLGLQDKLNTMQSCFQRTEANLNQQAQFYKKQLDEAKKEYLELEQRRICSEMQKKLLEQENEGLRRELEELRVSSESYLGQLKRLQREIVQKQKQMVSAKIQIRKEALMSKQTQESQTSAHQREVRNLNQQIVSLRKKCQHQLQGLVRQKDLIEKQLNDLRKESLLALQNAHAERSQLQKTNLLFRQQLKQANSIIRFLNSKLDKTITSNDTASRGRNLKNQLQSSLQRIIEERGTDEGVSQIVEQMLKTQTDFKNRCHQLLSP